MTRYIKMNYKNDPKYSKTLWKCEACSNIDSESHILRCKEYEDLRDGKDLQNNQDLCEYIQKVIKIREKQEESPKNSKNDQG